MELIIPLDPQGKRPLYEQIYRHIKTEIRNGNLKPQMRLPSTRRLAENLKVSRSTTQLAYEQLVSEGYLAAVPRKVYFPARLEGLVAPVEPAAARPGGVEGHRLYLAQKYTEPHHGRDLRNGWDLSAQ